MRQHLAAYEKQTGSIHPSLIDAPTLPPGCSALWSDFIRMHQDRQCGMAPAPISSRDILDWQAISGVRLAAWEIDAIRAADAAFFEVSG